MDSAHARIANELSTGALHAAVNFQKGRETVENPFSKNGQHWAWVAYGQRMRKLICERDHGTGVCCQEHEQHAIKGSSTSFMGYTSCKACEKEVDKLRAIRIAEREAEKNEPATG